MQRILLAVLLLAAVALAPAPTVDQPQGSEYYPESTDSQLADQQKSNTFSPSTGWVPPDHRTPDFEPGSDDAAGMAALDAASKKNAEDALRKAGKRAGSPPPWQGALLGTGVVVVAFGVVFAVRQVANRVVPEPPTRKGR